LLFLAGLCTTIGLQPTMAFFMKKKNRKVLAPTGAQLRPTPHSVRQQ
jgi:hypothetical protein